jgi:hypothetical protein
VQLATDTSTASARAPELAKAACTEVVPRIAPRLLPISEWDCFLGSAGKGSQANSFLLWQGCDLMLLEATTTTVVATEVVSPEYTLVSKDCPPTMVATKSPTAIAASSPALQLVDTGIEFLQSPEQVVQGGPVDTITVAVGSLELAPTAGPDGPCGRPLVTSLKTQSRLRIPATRLTPCSLKPLLQLCQPPLVNVINQTPAFLLRNFSKKL